MLLMPITAEKEAPNDTRVVAISFSMARGTQTVLSPLQWSL